MFEIIEKLLNRLRSVWDDMSLNQKVISSTGLAALLFAAFYISTLSDRMINYTVLFAQLDASSASEVITQLDQQGVPYRITQGGTAIEVPVDQADRLKIELVSQGLPQSGIAGYEILDATNFGMSDFLQKQNYRRAMEGELRRTLQTLNEIEAARVHLVIPEPSLYTESKEPPTASVVLKLRGNRTLTPSQVDAIANLVASAAVEGLSPKDVTIIDTGGNQLSKPVRDELAMQSSTVMELKMAYEKNLESRVKSMIDGAFGPGTALVMVNADIDFDHVERQTTSFDQENSAIMSETRREVTNPSADGGGEEEITTNYDTGKIIENLVRTPGSNVKRLSVSVMIDEKEVETTSDDGSVETSQVPWTTQELASIRSITETAVGFDAQRGDRIEVVNMAFGGHEPETVERNMTVGTAIVQSVGAMATGIAIIVALYIFYLILKNIISTLDPSKMKIEAEEELKKILPSSAEGEQELPERAAIIRKILERTTSDPEKTAKTIKAIYKQE
ncbi:MAG: flagellar M-ring protein FliF [Candidatus Latescibacteria bacterium]|nr:flagellar M-ring protein FliF [Candidatus Latescibacterota bacterium]